MKKILFCMLFIFLFASGSVKQRSVDVVKIKDVSKSVDEFTSTLDRLEVATSKLNKALK